jgi:hypothetical protein
MKEPKYGPKYGKYIIDRNVKRPKEHPTEEPQKSGGGLVVFCDDDVIKGAFYLNCALMTNKTPDNAIYRPEMHGKDRGDVKKYDISKIGKPHAHDFDEYIILMGTNTDVDRRDLGGEVELWLGGEKQVITRSCGVWIPAGLFHLPINFLRIDRPILFMTTAPALLYMKYYDPDPKWNGYLELGG